jgi:GNAT superfamily N-acetyltransferase
MQAKCFECEAAIEAEDADAVADRFIEHAAATHEWTYPEEALRNFARNFVEAVERVAGAATERLDTIGPLEIHPVTTDRMDDWRRLFDRDGFADNPDWGSCYCLEPHAPPPPDMPERPWRENRAMTEERLANGTTVGYLAYADGKPVGWVNASVRAEYVLFKDIEPGGPDTNSIVGVSCFVIAPPYRRHGVASALLDRVIADAPSRGAAWVEAYPNNEAREGDPGHFRGARSMYETRGFEVVEVRERNTVMRKKL